MVKNTDTGTVWMWENNRIASLEKFPAAVCLKVKMEVEERAPVKLASSKRNVTANNSGAQAQVGTRRDEEGDESRPACKETTRLVP